MATNQVMAQCRACGKTTLHLQPATSHVLHLLLSLITLGAWIIVWFFVAQNNTTQKTCTVCGTMKGLFGTTRGGSKPSGQLYQSVPKTEAIEDPATREKKKRLRYTIGIIVGTIATGLWILMVLWLVTNR